MSESSPADLVVSFRSLPRRLREAQADTPPEFTAVEHRSLQSALAAAADALHCAAEPLAIADAIEARPADSWPEPDLDSVRAAALAAGRHLRSIAAASGDTDD
jgi:hypothetical protein